MGDTIDRLVKDTADKIKALLLEAVEGLEFPEILIGIHDLDAADDPELAKTLFEKLNRGLPKIPYHDYAIGIALPKKGIMVHIRNPNWPIYTILFPDGLCTFESDRYYEIENGQLTPDKNHFPNWKSKREEISDYINYGSEALQKIDELKGVVSPR